MTIFIAVKVAFPGACSWGFSLTGFLGGCVRVVPVRAVRLWLLV